MDNKKFTYKFTLAFITTLILSLLVFLAVALNVTAQNTITENTSIVSDIQYEKDGYKQAVYDNTRTLENSATMSTMLYETKDSYDFTAVESLYYIHIQAQAINYEPLQWGIGFSKSEESFYMSFTKENNSLRLDLGIYDSQPDGFPGYTFEYNSGELNDRNLTNFYFVFKDNKFCIGTENIEETYNNPIFVFAKGSADNEVYTYMLNHLLTSDLQCYLFADTTSLDDTFLVEEHCEITIDMDLPIRKGYEFLGWYYDSACTQKYTANPVKDTTELFPKWRALAFKVIFDTRVENNPNFGEEVVKYYDYNAVIDYIPNEPEGYAFVGWYYDNGNVKYCGEPITENTAFRAEFTKCYYVTFYDQYRKPLKSQRVLENEIPEIPVHKEIGYKFVGWWNEQAMSDYNKEPITENTSLIATMLEAKCKVSLYVNNEIYKAYSVGYGLPLDKFLSENKINQIFISKYQNYDLTGAEIPISDFNIEKDMRIDISEKYITAINFENSINANKGLIATCLIAFGVLIVVWVVLYVVSKTTKPKKATKKKAK